MSDSVLIPLIIFTTFYTIISLIGTMVIVFQKPKGMNNLRIRPLVFVIDLLIVFFWIWLIIEKFTS